MLKQDGLGDIDLIEQLLWSFFFLILCKVMLKFHLHKRALTHTLPGPEKSGHSLPLWCKAKFGCAVLLERISTLPSKTF